MTLEIEVYPPVNVNQYVMLGGRLDTLSHAQLDEALAPMLAARPQALVLDLAHLDYISSAGVRSILKARKALAPHEGRLLVVHCASGTGGVAISHRTGFETAARPVWYGDE